MTRGGHPKAIGPNSLLYSAHVADVPRPRPDPVGDRSVPEDFVGNHALMPTCRIDDLVTPDWRETDLDIRVPLERCEDEPNRSEVHADHLTDRACERNGSVGARGAQAERRPDIGQRTSAGT